MAINLRKGQKIALTGAKEGLKSIMVGLGWAPVSSSSGLSFLSVLFKKNVDCDASVILCGADGKVVDNTNVKESVVYYANLAHSSGAIVHMGDNLTGNGAGDDEQIKVDLPKVPERIHKLVFVVNIYDAGLRGQHFGMLKNAFIRLVNMENNTEICRFELNEDYDKMTGLIVGEIYRDSGKWQFNAVGQAVQDGCLDNLIARYL